VHAQYQRVTCFLRKFAWRGFWNLSHFFGSINHWVGLRAGQYPGFLRPDGGTSAKTMNGLLREVLAAHGGIDRWKRYENVSATIVSGGDLFDAKGVKVDTTPRKVSTATKSERMIARPFGNPDWKMTFVPDCVVIEDGKGVVVAGRNNPRDAFVGQTLTREWLFPPLGD
jgi:hypothetical protein